MQQTELTKEQRKEIYAQNAAEAAETALIDYSALREVGFDEEQAMRVLLAWHGRSIVG